MYDVIVVGGGPAGLAAAIALAERNVKALVVDHHGGISPERGELLAHGALDIVARLGLSAVLNEAVQIDDVISYWGTARMQSHTSVPGLGFHGWGISRRRLSFAMVHRVKALGLPIHSARVTTIDRKFEGWNVDTSDEKSHLARYLIDATGRPGAVARRQGAGIVQDRDLVALIWSTSRSPGHAHMRAEAAPDGWWYAVPFGENQTVGFVTSAQHAKEINNNTPPFLQSARQTTRLIDLNKLGAPHKIMDCRSAALKEMFGLGWIATGDAAAAFDPVSSQGLFNALSSGFFAANAAVDFLAGDVEAPLAFAFLVTRTANRTHSMTRLQYGAMPFETNFWRERASVFRMMKLIEHT